MGVWRKKDLGTPEASGVVLVGICGTNGPIRNIIKPYIKGKTAQAISGFLDIPIERVQLIIDEYEKIKNNEVQIFKSGMVLFIIQPIPFPIIMF
jgi:hypothetical protein